MLTRSLFYCVSLFAAFYPACSASDPAPIAVPVPTFFLGDDGLWSPITLRVGTPPQYLYALPNTASQETWLIGPGGCDGTYTCQNLRGGLFYADQSSTFTNIGDYYLNTDPQFENSDYGDYGLDVVALNDQDAVNVAVVGILNTTDFWLGQFGLGVAQTRFNDTSNRLTFLSSLVETDGLIPSHSYGYTAGAYYRLKNVPGSLTLGGFDTNRFIPNSATFSLDPNQKPTLAVNRITVSASQTDNPSFPSWSANPLRLLDNADASLFTIDSSTPFLWLPEVVCDAFAAALGLVYDDGLQLYLFESNGTSPSTLLDWGLLFSFSISDYPGSNTNVLTLNVPYSAFNLQLSFPYPGLNATFGDAATSYFPLRKANDSSQYTIGRAFLQETYLAVDYERNNFSISQAKFTLDALTNINLVPITRPANSNYTGPYEPNNSNASTGLKVGVGVAVAIAALAIAGLCWYIFVFRKHRKAAQGTRLPDKETPSTSDGSPLELAGDNIHPFTELPASRHFPAEAPVDAAHARTEMPATVPIEMPAAEPVSAAFYAPARRSSMRKDRLEILGNNAPADQILPPYSPSAGDSRIDGISPDSPHPSGRLNRNSGTNTTSSSDRIVSPISGSNPGISRNPSGPETPVMFSPLVDVTPSFPFPLRQLPLDGYRVRGTTPGNVETSVELHDRGRPARFSWEGSEV